MKKRDSGSEKPRSSRALVVIIALTVAVCIAWIALHRRSDTSQPGSPTPSPSPAPTVSRDTSSPEAVLNTYAQAFNARDADMMYSILSSDSKRYNDLGEVSSYLGGGLVGEMEWRSWNVTSTTQDPYDNNARNLRVSFTSSEPNPFGAGNLTQTLHLTFKAVLENGEWLWDAGLSLILSG